MKKAIFILSALFVTISLNSTVLAICPPGPTWTQSWTDSYGQTTYSLEAPCKVYIGIPFNITATVTDNSYPDDWVGSNWAIKDNGSTITGGEAILTVAGLWQRIIQQTYSGAPEDHTLEFVFVDMGQGGGAHGWNETLIGAVTVDPFPPAGPNGDFESGYFTSWDWTGNVGLDTIPFAINGTWTAFLNTQGIGNVCSWLYSDDISPTYVPRAIKVKFKIRFFTNEPITPTQYEDPFHAMLKFDDGNGDVTLVTVSSNAVSAATGVRVQDLTSGAFLPSRAIPNFFDGTFFGFDWASNVMQVSGTIPYNSCAPVNIRFDICNSLDDAVQSTAQVDDVDITFVNGPGATTTSWKSAPSAPVPCK